MSLRLSSAEITALEHATTVLLAPFSYDSPESWRRAAAHAVADCVGGDAASLEMLLPGMLLLAAEHVDRRKALLQLLYPAYCTGINIFLAMRQNIAAFTTLAEHASIGVLMFDANCRALSENEFFERLMCADPDRARVRGEIARSVRGFMLLTACISSGSHTAPARSDYQSVGGCYHIVVTLIDHPWSPDQRRVIALVERTDGRRLDVREVAAQFSLTQRELDCAVLLAKGLSSREMASCLRISINTARRHVERIFLKLDVHNRAAAVAKLTILSLACFLGDWCDLIALSGVC